MRAQAPLDWSNVSATQRGRGEGGQSCFSTVRVNWARCECALNCVCDQVKSVFNKVFLRLLNCTLCGWHIQIWYTCIFILNINLWTNYFMWMNTVVSVISHVDMTVVFVSFFRTVRYWTQRLSKALPRGGSLWGHHWTNHRPRSYLCQQVPFLWPYR